ncbi:TRAP transporter small permease subunit [Zhongshania sp.]|uniref:TRAP transporter small permease subunit n=1 Tax=Zhongshania sp. TaxID=1971902 RepID=UPI001B4A469D|nr:TRAP transporter small permease subunit [Zhongshania sp.]MBQ0796457.1 TRAP transporter small permease subunit [Zhongshania sp.]
MKQCVYLIDSLTERLGRLLAWLIPLMMLGTTSVVVMRYGFGQGMTALQESVSYLHGIVFMLGAAYTLKHGGHVRVDIFYRRFSPRTKAWVDSIGSIVFLLPLCGLILITSWDFTLNAWAIHETSVEPGGLPFVYLLKTLLPLMAINLAMQGFAELLRNAMVLMGSEANVHAD